MDLHQRIVKPARSYGFLFLVSFLMVRGIQATCDDSQCPIICRGVCPDPDPAIPPATATATDPSDPTSCREILIESPGYPNGYPGDKECQWRFSATEPASVSIETIESRGHDAHILTVEFVRGGRPPSTIYSGILAGLPLYRNARGELLRITWDPTAAPAGSFIHTGFQLRIAFGPYDAGDACSSAGQEYELTEPRPLVGINSPRYPILPSSAGTCYYTITSPGDTQIVIHFPGRFQLEEFDDYIYVYDISSAEPKLLRIITGSTSRFRFSPVRTGTNMVRLVFTDEDGSRGVFFARVGYEDLPPSPCNGKGVIEDECVCPTGAHDYCHVSDDVSFQVLPDVSDASGLTMDCTGDDATVFFILDHTTDGSAATFASNNYFDFATAGPQAVSCIWNIEAPTDGDQLMVNFRDIDLDVTDSFFLRYRGGRIPFGIFRFATSDTTLPVDSSNVYQLVDNPIFLDAGWIEIEYEGNTDDFSANRGVLFDVHLLGKGPCSQPCLNGGECTAACDCEFGFSGRNCEHTTPIDFMCIVKNHYIKSHFAYDVQFYAVAGTNAWGTEAFRFDYYRPSKSSDWYNNLPAPIDVDYGRVLSIPAGCDKKERATRTGAFVCIFDGDEWVDPVQIPVIVNPASDHITPNGRYTKTVSVGDSTTLSVGLPSGRKHSVRWKFNDLVRQKWNGQSSITIEDIREEDCGIYEAFINRPDWKEYDAVTYRLIVRKCPPGEYGPGSCTPCPQTCHNGGTCHDLYGTCICPPAYSGADCSELLTGSIVSRNTGLTCPNLGIAYRGCKEIMICLPDPGGCMCMPGWMGNFCDQACPSLTFGLECQYDCHCDSGDQCDVATGRCPNGCDAAYTGANCQMTT